MTTRATFDLSDRFYWNAFHPRPTKASVPIPATMASVLGLAKMLTYKATVMVPIFGREAGIGKMLGRPKLMQNARYRDSHSWKSNSYG